MDTNGEYDLLTTKYVLEVKRFSNDSDIGSYVDSSLREWLNNEFFNIAFDRAEKDIIVATTFTREDGHIEKSGSHNSKFVDRVFVLNKDEAKKYFKTNEDRKCYPTEYAKMLGAIKNNGASSYWLRTPTKSKFYEIYVTSNGMILDSGASYVKDYIGVRPCILIKIGDIPKNVIPTTTLIVAPTARPTATPTATATATSVLA